MTRKLIAFSICALLFALAPLWAQQGAITLNLKDVPVADALRAVQEQVPDFQYTLHEGVTGTVTIYLTDVSVATAVRAISTALDAAYRLDQGVYVIEPKPVEAQRELPSPLAPTYAPPMPPGPRPPQPPGEASNEPVVRVIKVKHADPADIAMIFGGTVISSRMGQLAWGGGGMGLGMGGYGGQYGGYGGQNGGYGGQYGGRGVWGGFGPSVGGGGNLGGRWGNGGYGGVNYGNQYGNYGGYGYR